MGTWLMRIQSLVQIYLNTSTNTKGSEEPDCFIKFPAILDVVSFQPTVPYI